VSELIVDGYNIIHAWPELALLIRGGRADEARRRLVTALGEYAAATDEHVTVVFDAHSRPRGGGDERVDGVAVVFGNSSQTADHVIERRVAVAAGDGVAGSVIVATSDRLQRDMVMAMGAAVIGAMALRDLVRGVEGEIAEHRHRRRREAGLANRLEDRLDPEVRGRLDAMRRPPAEPPAGDPADVYKP
jgi:predicted RNA-binding protein with PIN domain